MANTQIARSEAFGEFLGLSDVRAGIWTVLPAVSREFDSLLQQPPALPAATELSEASIPTKTLQRCGKASPLRCWCPSASWLKLLQVRSAPAASILPYSPLSLIRQSLAIVLRTIQ